MMDQLRSMTLRAVPLVVGMLVWSSGVAYAAKEAFTRTKPHVNVGTIGGEPVQIWVLVDAGIFGDGTASGIVQLRVVDGESFLYRVTGGRLEVNEETVVELVLFLERVGEGGDSTGETDEMILRPSSASDECLIYDLVGADVHGEAEGRIELRYPPSTR